jgi:hypothetical protein
MGWQEQNPYPAQAGNPDVVIASAMLNIGAAGAVSSVSGAPGVAAANAGAGLFSVTYPPSVDVYIQVTVKSAAATVITGMVTARVPGSGTATVRTNNAAGAATNPASGDEVHIQFYARTSSA